MKVFVTGVCGQLGHDVVNECQRRGYEVIGSDIQNTYSGIDVNSYAKEAPYISLDITDEEKVLSVIRKVKPDVIVSSAAWTKVDDAEDEDKKTLVYRINVQGPANLSKAALEMNCKMIQISTDYVFRGDGEKPWEADSRDFNPSGYYGETKLGGEEAVRSLLQKYFIVRIAWVFGLNGQNFVKTMLKVGRSHDKVRVVNDQIGTPTYTYDLSKLLCDMMVTEKYGTYHATNEGGFISWYDFTKEIYRQAGLKTAVNPVTTEEYGLSKAVRPKNSRLSKEKLSENGFQRLPDWRDALHRYLIELGEISE